MCTAIRFNDAGDGMWFGRNLDWVRGYGERVVVTPPAARVPAAFERPGEPERGRAVIGMGIVAGGVPLYFDCANDAGLAVAGLNFPQSARYAEGPREGVVNVAAYEFPYWACRNHASVEEVRRALADVVVVARPVSDELPVASLHWMVADATGAIVVECLEGGLRAWEDDADVLTNEPDFGWHRQNLRNYLALDASESEPASWGAARLEPFGSGMGTPGLPGGWSGPDRFVRAAFANARHPVREGERANLARLLRTLGSVAVPMGSALMPDGGSEHTLYASGFSSAERTYYHVAYDGTSVGRYPLAACDLTGTEPFEVPDAGWDDAR